MAIVLVGSTTLVPSLKVPSQVKFQRHQYLILNKTFAITCDRSFTVYTGIHSICTLAFTVSCTTGGSADSILPLWQVIAISQVLLSLVVLQHSFENKMNTPTINSYSCQSMEEFIAKTESLFGQYPNDTRYVMKFNNKKGRMNFKTTNDKFVIKFKTDQASDLQHLEKLNNMVMTVTTSKSK